MTGPAERMSVRVTHRFGASAERVYDAFLDPARASQFMFATPTGQIVRCEIDARVGGRFTIVDRRAGEDVVHTGEFVALERPRLIEFLFSVSKYAHERSRVTIEIAPLRKGCELTLTHELSAADAASRDRTQEGWLAILDAAAEMLVDEAPTCGMGVAQHASIPAKIGMMFDGLAETLELHRKMLVLDDPNARQEDDVYRDLAASWRHIAELVQKTAATMAAQRELPMGAHDMRAWGDEHLRAFQKFVKGQSQVLSLLRVAAERDERMLALMNKTA